MPSRELPLPPHFEADRVGEVWRVPYQERAAEAERWAREHDALVLEDDYDGEYRFGGTPAPSLQSLDPDGRVVYFGTFSKTLLPSLGVGYLVVPKRYVDIVSRLIDLVGARPTCRPS